jgi:hypothetical protein
MVAIDLLLANCAHLRLAPAAGVNRSDRVASVRSAAYVPPRRRQSSSAPRQSSNDERSRQRGTTAGACSCPRPAAHSGAGQVEIVTASRRRRSCCLRSGGAARLLQLMCVPANAGLELVGSAGGRDHVGDVRAIRATQGSHQLARDARSAMNAGLGCAPAAAALRERLPRAASTYPVFGAGGPCRRSRA